MLRDVFLLIGGLLLTLGASGQVGKTVFETEEHDFGTIPEQGGSVSYTFEFTNTGDAPLVVQSVSTSCGCTASEWSNTPVLPGKKGSITASYNPQGRPGVFLKTISVRTNGEKKDFVLRIRGSVVPRTLSPAQQYQQRYGDIGLRASHLSLGQVWKDTVKSERLEMYNFSDREMEVRFDGLPPHVSIAPNPLALPPQSVGQAQVAIDGTKTSDWGLVMESVRLVTKEATGDITLLYTLGENFAAMGHEEYLTAPRIAFEPESLDLGELQQGRTKEVVLRVGNTGHRPLELRKVSSSCDCLTVSFSPKPIEPNDGQDLRLAFRSGSVGTARVELTIISNDPTRSVAVVKLQAQVR